MIWIVSTEKDTDKAAFGKRLWATAEQCRAKSGLKAHELSTPAHAMSSLRFLLRNLECVMPTDSPVSHFSERSAPLLGGILTLQRQIQEVCRTRGLLRPLLLSGQVQLFA
jgi:hypothetical protein